MCRFTYYQGPPLRISSLVVEPTNSLIQQSAHSRERREPVNGDGFGMAWYTGEPRERPAFFHSITPAWNNSNLLEIARVIESRVILAHVRDASQERSVSEVNCHPFTSGCYSFMHNGEVGGFGKVRRALLRGLSNETFDGIKGSTDTEHAFALLLDALRAFGALPTLDQMAASVRTLIAQLLELVERYAPGSASDFNFVLSNGQCAIATRFTTRTDGEGESLHLNHGRHYVCENGLCNMIESGADQGAVLVASEALSSDPGWEMIPRNTLVAIDAAGLVRYEELGDGTDPSRGA